MSRRVFITRPTYVPKVDAQKHSQTGAVGDTPTPPPLRGGDGGGVVPASSRPNEQVPENNVDRILAATKNLTAKERQELLDQLALSAQMTRKADQDRDLDMWAAAVYEVLVSSPGARGESGYGQMVVKRLLAPTAIWRPVQEFMAYSKLQELKVPERQSVYMLLAELLVRHAREVSERSGAPLGPKLVGNCTGDIRGVFEKSFPGYIRNGLAKIAARQLVMQRAS